jgi:hypothetical protein
MNHLLDALMSTIIGGFLLFLLIRFNGDMATNSYEMVSGQQSHQNAIATIRILDSDLYRIGHKVSGEKIKTADSTTLKYYSDLDNNGVVDSLLYYTGQVTALNSTTNPKDKPIYRKLNTNQPELIGAVIRFRLTYFDSTGTQLTYTNLTNATEREKIKTIRMQIGFESDTPQDSVYQGVDLIRTIRPKNLNL